MQMPSVEELRTIIARRDRRYDGRFYFGVRTTRIYCRPVCPARPKVENITLFRSPSEAEQNGYRPCLRCRPDAAPGSKLLDGTLNTVSRALRIIQSTLDEELGVEALAATLGVSDRHLRRLFDEHLGASPIEIMTTQRLHFAKQALLETALPIAEIAYASGFKSLRRFNEAFKARYRTTPTGYRGSRARGSGDDDVVTLRLPVRPPYDWGVVLAYLGRHETYGIERVEDDAYTRYIPTGDGFGRLTVRLGPKADHLAVTFSGLGLADVRTALGRIRSLFDTSHDPASLPRGDGLDPGGVRVPGSYDPFETAVSIVLSQLVSTVNAKARLAKLVQRFGKSLGIDRGRPVLAFPDARTLADAPLEELGLTRAMAQALRSMAAAVADGALDFRAPVAFDVATAQLLAIRGVGPWTAAMIAMRCLGDPDAFPERDLIVQRALEGRLVDASAWAASRAYLVHCLWRDHGTALSRAHRPAPRSTKGASSWPTRSTATRPRSGRSS
jgi:AraC family transcriptional regulator of adaptative response / DNA-3-methyladenine glycosylase II